MSKKLLLGTLLTITGIALMAGITLTTKIYEPAFMLFFGTVLVGVAGIMEKKPTKR